MGRRVLITGGAGMLATDLSHTLSYGGHEVLAPSHGQLEVTDGTAVDNAISVFHPDTVIHTAAMHVDPCERDPAAATRVNAQGSQNLAVSSERHGAELVYISTCGLFGDEIRAYSETDDVVLKSVYAKTKYEGEQLVLAECARAFVVRPGWLFGGEPSHQKNFVMRRFEEAREADVVQSAGDKHGCPTYTGDLAVAILALLDSKRYGTYHLKNDGNCTRAGYVRGIVEAFGLSTQVEEVDSSFFPRPAPTPDCEILCSNNLSSAGLEPMPHWEDAMARYVDIVKPEAT
jgi:dTDP-4-dehydrorhamnose reductase